jgi:hypothetical protein
VQPRAHSQSLTSPADENLCPSQGLSIQLLPDERSVLVRKSLVVSLLVAWSCAGFGCGNSAGVYPVTGKVLYRGEPAVGATVTFVHKGGAARPQEHIPQGVVGEDGTFALASPLGAGAAPGEYAVLVEWKVGAGKTKGRSPGLTAPDRLQRRYLDPARPLLTATVEAKTNSLPPFDLQ